MVYADGGSSVNDVFIHLFIYLSIYLSIYLFIYLSIYLNIHLFGRLFKVGKKIGIKDMHDVASHMLTKHQRPKKIMSA